METIEACPNCGNTWIEIGRKWAVCNICDHKDLKETFMVTKRDRAILSLQERIVSEYQKGTIGHGLRSLFMDLLVIIKETK